MAGRGIVRFVSRLVLLPSLGPVVVDEETKLRFAAAADALLAGAGPDIPVPRVEFIRWLAANRDVVFHGSPQNGLTEVSTERRSRDTRAWGNQPAVYATTDPVWAIYFACLRRDGRFRGTRNGSLGAAGGPLYPRSYFFAHNRGSASAGRFGPGTLYVLPPKTFVAEPPLAGALDTGHLVSPTPVRPLARIAVTPEDFPFRDHIRYFREHEPVLVSILRCRSSGDVERAG